MKITKIILLLLFVISYYRADSQHYIDSTITYLKGGTNINVLPGDTIYLINGNKPFLLLENIHGSPDSTIVIINYNGKVEISTNHYFGISTKNCSFFKITGTGDSTIKYGIDISRVANGSGIGISNLSNNFELDHIKISNTFLAGIYAKTDPDSTLHSARDSFLMKNVKIHDLYLENINDEGMYIGSTKYFGQMVHMNGRDTLVLPHLIENIEISNNFLKNTGWDGIQLSSAYKNAAIHDNVIINDSYRDYYNQMSGIILGGGTKADCYNNFILNGHGTGIVVASLGGQQIFNNIIINSGTEYFPNDLTKMQHGIYVGDISVENDSSFYLFNNLIVNPKSDGIRFTSLNSKNNIAVNNIIINPGNYLYYDTLHTHFTANDAYIMISDTSCDIELINNYYSLYYQHCDFTDTISGDFTLLAQSQLIDAGTPVNKSGALFDFYHHPRNIGASMDIGPFEFNPAFMGIINIEEHSKKIKIYPNPTNSILYVERFSDIKFNTISIYQIDGRLIYSKPLKEKTDFIDTKCLKPGIYYIILKRENETTEKIKFIKVN